MPFGRPGIPRAGRWKASTYGVMNEDGADTTCRMRVLGAGTPQWQRSHS
jgi:hypothetical protein